MKDKFLQLLELFRSARPATRLTLVLSTLAVLATAGVSSWFATRPDLVQLWSGLTSAEAAEYKRALAQASIAFRSSPPPENGIWVDVSDRDAAEAQVALGGYKPSNKGIQITDGGVDSAFMSARTREQMAEKREWQECELQLERLNFVERATVCSSSQVRSAFGRPEAETISVTLGLRHGYFLDEAQARTVATLVRSRFNVPLENITVVDEQGNLLHDGGSNSSEFDGEDLYAYKRRYDADAERRANAGLEMALGQGMARVTVNSVWSYEELESIRQSALPKESAPYYEESSKTEGSSGSAVAGGEAGISSNITQDFGVESAGTEGGGSERKQTSEDSIKRSVVGHSTEHRTSRTPQITRLNVALIADESAAEDIEELQRMVKAAVGFDAERKDQFESFIAPLASVERDDEGAPVLPEPAEPAPAPNEYVELLIEHGVEILAALAFVFVLFKSLKGGGKVTGEAVVAKQASADGKEVTEEQLESIDPELLARVQVEELVKNDPERVSEILAGWASEIDETIGAGR